MIKIVMFATNQSKDFESKLVQEGKVKRIFKERKPGDQSSKYSYR